jgi:sulfite exporter TauE/SafE
MILVGGLLGSAHCVGMCGGFVLSLGMTRHSAWNNLARQLTYSLGRVFTYTFGGAAAGYVGWRLTVSLPAIASLQATLAIAAGLLLVIQGLTAAGLLNGIRVLSKQGACLGPAFFAGLLHAPGWRNVFIAGLINGLLPCGLVYAYLALAISAGDMPRGALTMLLFGLGTIPVMVLVGCGGSLLRLTLRRRLVRAAAWCVVLTGVLSIVRGTGFVQLPGVLEPMACPLCHTSPLVSGPVDSR